MNLCQEFNKLSIPAWRPCTIRLCTQVTLVWYCFTTLLLLKKVKSLSFGQCMVNHRRKVRHALNRVKTMITNKGSYFPESNAYCMIPQNDYRQLSIDSRWQLQNIHHSHCPQHTCTVHHFAHKDACLFLSLG